MEEQMGNLLEKNMPTKFRTLLTLLTCSYILLGGCSTKGGLITSLEDLTTESSKEGFIKVPQYRVISVPGILPFADAGSLQFYKPRRKPSSAVGLSNGDSYVMESVIKSECDENCLRTIRDNLLLLRGKAESLVEARINLTRILAIALPDGSDADKINTFNLSVAGARKEYKDIRDEFNVEYKKVISSINNNGILIYRWNSNSKKKGSFGLGKIFNLSGDKNETYSGFALISGLRFATLYVGHDLISAWETLNTKSKYRNRFELTTFVMQARHILYVAEYDLQSVINAKLKASYAQLNNIPQTVKDLDQIEINATLSKVTNLSNTGIVGKSRRKARDVDWSMPAGIVNLSELDGWQTFFSVESDLTDLMEIVK